MKVEKFEATAEKDIVTAMIVSTPVLGKIADKWMDDGLFHSSHSNIIGRLCCDYFTKYGKAPGKAIAPLWEDQSETMGDEGTIELVNRFLTQLSENYSQLKSDINPEFILDRAENYLNGVRLTRLSESIAASVAAGNIKKGLSKLNKFSSLEMASSSRVDIFDPTLIESVFKQKQERLIEFEGAFGNFVNDMMRRDEFIAIMAPEKTGKTWWLMEFGLRGVLQNRRVAFFEVGDMSTEQLMLRLYQRFTKHPEEPQLVKWPTFLDKNDEGRGYVTSFEEIEYDKPLSKKQVQKALKDIKSKLQENDRFRLSVHPNSSITVGGIDQILETWKRESGWQPDIICIDYADIIAPSTGIQDTRDQINSTWKHLRRINQKWHCLLITATQTDAASYSTHLLSRKNFSEDKRKFAHCTGMLGLNINEEDKENQQTRINWVVLRSRKFSESKVVYVAGCLDVGRPLVLSSF